MIWKDGYKIRIELIDEQDKDLFRRVSDFTQLLSSIGNFEISIFLEGN